MPDLLIGSRNHEPFRGDRNLGKEYPPLPPDR